MAAPNEELLLLAQTLEFSDNVRCTIQQAADLLQSQAERIKVLEAKVEQLKVVPMKYRRMEFNAQLQKENETLRTALAQQGEQTDQRLVNLLCRIHRDGGHYITKHGIDKAVIDADVRVAQLNALTDTAAPAPQLMQEDYATKSS